MRINIYFWIYFCKLEQERDEYLWKFSAMMSFLFWSSVCCFQTPMHFVKTETSRKIPPISSQYFQYIALHQATQAFPSAARLCARSTSAALSSTACILPATDSVLITCRCARLRVSEERRSSCARKRELRRSARRGGMRVNGTRAERRFANPSCGGDREGRGEWGGEGVLVFGGWREGEEEGVWEREEKRALREGSKTREWRPGEIREISWRRLRARKLCNDAELEVASVILLWYKKIKKLHIYKYFIYYWFCYFLSSSFI